MKTALSTALITILAALSARAAIPPKTHILQHSGSQIGGVAGSGFTLLDLRVTQDRNKKIERIVMDVGDMNGEPLKGLPGYFHVELKDNPQKLVIDLAQTPHSKVDDRKLAAAFQKSLAVSKTAITVDPTDNTLTISLDLKKNTRARVLQVAGQKQTSKVVVDLISE